MNLKIQKVSFSIQGKLIVKDVSITVNPGEVVGLMGPNGAGKTTTFNLAVGNIKPDKGEVLMNGKNITHLPLPIRSRLGLGYLTQEASIFRELTVKENIDLALQNSPYSSAAIRNRREQLINEFNLNKFVDNYGFQLSGGERRRCEIARALSVGRKGPKYLLLDEPFAGIDPLAVNDLKKLILKLSRDGVGILITDHNVRETLLITNKSYVLSEGKILAYGSSSDLANNRIVKKYYLGDNFQL
ncbi:LPS export ABC transporter ATP-binding protein [uncultured Prochlorococcus sp.]|uniref:LPS export ABC transporter ATP-binding protein n=1 Tax=uncultured Prochlorococcus sp. TaxID=159733 RepID=UPI00258B1713|nr:LPS export ABC transporter ATP-binding protein [uncultured Prochlorococcus sp.]